MDEERYRGYQDKKFLEHEDLCERCGNCCGLKDRDPCEHLERRAGDAYFCNIYEERFGTRRTAGGKKIKCVPIRDIFHKTWPGRLECAYVKTCLGR